MDPLADAQYMMNKSLYAKYVEKTKAAARADGDNPQALTPHQVAAIEKKFYRKRITELCRHLLKETHRENEPHFPDELEQLFGEFTRGTIHYLKNKDRSLLIEEANQTNELKTAKPTAKPTPAPAPAANPAAPDEPPQANPADKLINEKYLENAAAMKHRERYAQRGPAGGLDGFVKVRSAHARGRATGGGLPLPTEKQLDLGNSKFRESHKNQNKTQNKNQNKNQKKTNET